MGSQAERLTHPYPTLTHRSTPRLVRVSDGGQHSSYPVSEETPLLSLKQTAAHSERLLCDRNRLWHDRQRTLSSHHRDHCRAMT